MQLFRVILLRHAPNVIKRGFLSDAYSCTEKWNSRFSSQAFGNLSASDLGTQIAHRLSNKVPVTSLDYDIFVNKVQETDKQFLEYLENIMYKFQTTQSSLNTLASTSHAFVQNYIFHNEEYRLLELLRSRASTGVFLDEVSANHLLKRFVQKHDYRAAVSVMWELCLQSHLEQQPLTPYLTALWLHTISQSIKSEKYFERSDVDEADTEVVDDGDTDFRSVPYLRNPNYDGWFDIDRPRLQLGHCALSLASAIERQALVLFSDTLNHDLKEVAPCLSLLGFALVEDANRLLTFAKTVSESPGLSDCIDQEVLSAVERLIESSDRRSDDSEVKRGEPTLLTESDVNLTLKTFKELVLKFPPTKKSFHDTVASLVSTISKDAEILKAEQARVHELYASFETTREEIWRTEVERMHRREVLSSVKSRLRELADEEERLTYFDHTKEIEHKAWLAPRTRKERSWSRMKEWKKDLRNYQQKRQGGREAVENV